MFQWITKIREKKFKVEINYLSTLNKVILISLNQLK